jgi:hypothetical protein
MAMCSVTFDDHESAVDWFQVDGEHGAVPPTT